MHFLANLWPAVNRVETIFPRPSALATISRFYHAANVPHRDPPEETSTVFSVNFVEYAGFGVETTGRYWRLKAGDAFLSYPGMHYRCRHEEVCPEDVCLSVSLDRETVHQGGGVAPPAPRLPASSRLAYLRHRLLDALATRAPLSIESCALELVPALCPDSQQWSGRLFQGRQFAWYAARIAEVCEQLRSEFAAPLPLTALARTARMSPYHFSRVFRELAFSNPRMSLKSEFDSNTR